MASMEEQIKNRITIYPNFPKEGIDFKDVFPLFETPSLLDGVIELFAKNCKAAHSEKEIHAVIGLDARGFLFGPQLAKALGCSFVPARKKGKLPGKTISQAYTLEYGQDQLEVQQNPRLEGKNVVIVDDLMATGGTMVAACSLAEKANYNVLSCLTVVELTGLKGKDKLPEGVDFYSITQYEF